MDPMRVYDVGEPGTAHGLEKLVDVFRSRKQYQNGVSAPRSTRLAPMQTGDR